MLTLTHHKDNDQRNIRQTNQSQQMLRKREQSQTNNGGPNITETENKRKNKAKRKIIKIKTPRRKHTKNYKPKNNEITQQDVPMKKGAEDHK